MSTAKPSSPTTTAPAPPSQLFRFSLLTLLSVMTLAGFTSAIVFSRHWYVDERLLLAFWCAGLILGMSIGRLRGSHGVISGGLGAVVGCLLACALLLNDKLQLMRELADQEVTPYVAFAVTIGWFAAVTATLCHRATSAGVLERLWFNPQSRKVMIVLICCLGGLLLIWQFTRERPWTPTWEIDLARDGMPTFALSPHGDFLFVHYSTLWHGKEDPDRVFQLTKRGAIGHELPTGAAEQQIAFSPDGKRIAAGELLTFRIMDATSDTVLRTWPLKPIERVTQLQFTPTGEQLLVTTTTPKIQRLYVVDIEKDELPQPQLFPYAGYLFIDPTGETLLKVFDSKDETDERRVEIVNRKNDSLAGEIRDLPFWSHRPILSAHGDFVAFDQRVWQRTGGRPHIFVDQVVGLPAGGRAIVLDYQLRQQSGSIPTWLNKMPFVRHWLMVEDDCELQLVDIATGEIRTKSPAYQRMLEAVVSDDGKVVVSAALDGHLRIWKVPQP